MRKMRACCAAFLFLFAPFLYAQAEEIIPPSPIVKTALIIDAPSVKQGETFWAGVTFSMPKDWHIYWQNPGDSGIPTTLTWTLPEGLAAGDIAWPTPQRVEMSGIVNYGYSDRVTLAVPITSARDGISGTITVKANWLVCHETCIPESATLTAMIAPNATAAKEIEAARDLVPTALLAPKLSYRVDGGNVVLTLPASAVPNGLDDITSAAFFPLDDGVLSNHAAQQFAVDTASHTLTITAQRGEAAPVNPWSGVLVFHRGDQVDAYQVTAAFVAASDAVVETIPAAAAPVSVTFVAALTLAFLGGLLLNVMPCVLPILALKALAIAKKAKVARKAAAHQGMAYTVGVIVSFLAIAAIMLALKASGAAIGWGFQLQNTGFVVALAAVMLLVSANLLGLFSLPVLFGSHAHEVNENSLLGSFLTGTLAVLVATPCSAPFMATAIGATLAFPPLQALAVFATLGVGMASPFLLISLWPAALRLIPKPGRWMVRFKQILALPMLATAAWLVWVLVQMQNGPMQGDATREMYSPARLTELRNGGTPVLVDATAAWCLTCKVNERVALRPAAMQQFLRDHQVVLMVADWTASDPAITAYLAGFGRNGVPLYVYYPPHGAPVVLPQILTPALVRAAIQPAGE